LREQPFSLGLARWRLNHLDAIDRANGVRGTTHHNLLKALRGQHSHAFPHRAGFVATSRPGVDNVPEQQVEIPVLDRSRPERYLMSVAGRDIGSAVLRSPARHREVKVPTASQAPSEARVGSGGRPMAGARTATIRPADA